MRRQTADSEFSHWSYSEDELIQRILENFDNHVKGYRDGVILVPIAPDGAFSALAKLKAGDTLVGEFRSRREGEDPRKSTYVIGEKQPAKRVDIVLYHKDVLAEDSENIKDLTGADWEMVSFNANITEEEMPIHPMVFMHNHFGSDGGTDTGQTPEEFEAQLRESFAYWNDKAFVKPKEKIGLIKRFFLAFKFLFNIQSI